MRTIAVLFCSFGMVFLSRAADPAAAPRTIQHNLVSALVVQPAPLQEIRYLSVSVLVCTVVGIAFVERSFGRLSDDPTRRTIAVIPKIQIAFVLRILFSKKCDLNRLRTRENVKKVI
jgi:hypothetical protein